MKPRTKKGAVLCLGLIAGAFGFAAAADEEAQVRAMTGETGALLAAQQFDAALAQARKTRQGPWTEKRAQALAHYNLAWTAATVGDAPARGEQRVALRQEAVDAYLAFLAIYPAHPAATENLVKIWIQLRDFDRARTALNTLLSATGDPEQQYRVHVALGDLALEQKDTVAAQAAYEAAEGVLPGAIAAPLREVQLYRIDRGRDVRDFLDTCRRFERAKVLPAAMAGYAAILHQARRWPEQRDEAVVRWTDVCTQSAAFSRAAAAQLPAPEDGESPGLKGVRLLLTAPLEANAAVLDWWRQGVFRRHVIAEAMRALAARERRTVKSGDGDDPALRTAERLLRLAGDLAPDDHVYESDAELKGRFPARLMAALDLAGLYSAQRAFDPGDQKFRGLERQLIDEKMIAYWEQNLPIIQSYHTVLGLIYADPNRAQWQENSINGAPFHLERAVRFAQRLAERNPADYQPMPQLTLIHARGIVEHPGRAEKARELFGDAAQGFLDAGNLKATEDALQGMAEAETRFRLPPSTRGPQLRRVLEIRQEAQKHAAVDRDQSRRWIEALETETPGLDRGFIQRQKAKTLIDLADRAFQTRNVDAAVAFKADALDALTDRPGITQVEVRAFEQLPTVEVRAVATDAASGTPPAAVAPAAATVVAPPPVASYRALEAATVNPVEDAKLVDAETVKRRTDQQRRKTPVKAAPP